jgi:hypothetical protein
VHLLTLHVGPSPTSQIPDYRPHIVLDFFLPGMPWQSDPLETVDLSEEPLTEQGAYPMVQPIRAALYFDNVKGFGEWRILISSRADKMLRKERKANKKTFRIMIKKIK